MQPIAWRCPDLDLNPNDKRPKVWYHAPRHRGEDPRRSLSTSTSKVRAPRKVSTTRLWEVCSCPTRPTVTRHHKLHGVQEVTNQLMRRCKPTQHKKRRQFPKNEELQRRPASAGKPIDMCRRVCRTMCTEGEVSMSKLQHLSLENEGLQGMCQQTIAQQFV